MATSKGTVYPFREYEVPNDDEQDEEYPESGPQELINPR